MAVTVAQLTERSHSLWAAYERSVDWRRGGFWAIDAAGDPVSNIKTTFGAARMVHSYALASLDSFAGAAPIVEHGLKFLRTTLRDPDHAGWFADDRGVDADDGTKSAYDHAFVLLASATATLAGFDADDLMDEALGLFQTRLLDSAGLAGSRWSRDWKVADTYRGANSNMHLMEALLAAYDATGSRDLLEAGRGIGRSFERVARSHDWRLPEHYDRHWVPQLEYNRARPHDVFRPYGSTPGHSAQWARLFLQANLGSEPETRVRMTSSAISLIDRAMSDSWDSERGGMIYTVDWDGTPVSRVRLHWPVAEAISVTAALSRVTGLARFASWQEKLWAFVDRRLIDSPDRPWIHELNNQDEISEEVLQGRPDLYHSIQATIAPRVRLRASYAAGLLDDPPR